MGAGEKFWTGHKPLEDCSTLGCRGLGLWLFLPGLEDGLVIWGQLDNKIACFVQDLCHHHLQNERNLVSYLRGGLWPPLWVIFRNVLWPACRDGAWGLVHTGALGSSGRKEWGLRSSLQLVWWGGLGRALWCSRLAMQNETWKYFCRACLKWCLEQSYISPVIKQICFLKPKLFDF